MEFLSLDLFLRLLCGLLVGALIGLDRNLHGKAAGVRTLGLVSLGSAAAVCVVTLTDHPPDAISRVIQGLLTGIGFLGVGVIARHGVHDRPQGLTTAAAIWLSAVLGAAAGAGYYAIVVIALVLGLLLMRFGGQAENVVHRWLGNETALRTPPARGDAKGRDDGDDGERGGEGGEGGESGESGEGGEGGDGTPRHRPHVRR